MYTRIFLPLRFCANYPQYESCNNQIADALDAYSRAAELDPSNVHIKARLQLLQSGQATNQGNAPVPQDVHPQAYQAASVAGPPGPQWGAQAPSGAPVQTTMPGRVQEWARGVNEMQGPAGQYDQRETLRGIQPQQPSPRTEQARQPFPEPQSRNNAGRKGLSPSPKFNLAAPNGYPGAQTLPQLGHPPQPSDRAPNGPPFGSAGRPPLAQNGPNGPSGPNGAAAGAQMPPYGRPFSPPTEIRPLRDDRPTSPRSTYPHPQYHPGPPPTQNGGIAGGAPPPAAAIAAAEAAQRERDERPPSSMKRGREWEPEQGPAKKVANEETRVRMDDPAGRNPSPRELRRRSSSEIRRDEQRRAHENYHPSEAAHHPPSLPSIQHMQPQQGPKIPSVPDTPKSVQGGNLPSSGMVSGPATSAEDRDRKEQVHNQHEPPARKMEVDEDYDDDGEDDKKGVMLPKSGSPGGPSTNGGVTNGTQSNQSKPDSS